MINAKQDPLWERAVEFIKGLEVVSAVMLQKQFRVTYMSAARIMDELLKDKLIDAARDEKGRHRVSKKGRAVAAPDLSFDR